MMGILSFTVTKVKTGEYYALVKATFKDMQDDTARFE
jgi:hypothetical protein